MNNRLRIIIADEDQPARETLQQSLTELGHEVQSVEGGASLLRLCRTNPPDLVFTGVELQEVDGITAAEMIHRRTTVPVVLLASHWDTETEGHAAAAGIARRLSKPVLPLELIATLEAVRYVRPSCPAPPPRLAKSPFEQFVESIDDHAIFTLDPTGLVTHWNRGSERLLGFPAAHIVGQSWELLFTPAELQVGLPRLELNVAISGRLDQQRWRVRRDGSRFWSVESVSPIRGCDQSLLGFGVILRDATRAKEREENVVSRGVALWDADEKRIALLNNVARELQEQLAPLANYARMLRGRTERPDLAGVGEKICPITESMYRTIEELLDTTRVLRGRIRLARKRLDARETIRRAAERSRPLMEAQRHALTTVVPAWPLWLQADPERLELVLLNLLSNAARYTPPGGRIELAGALEAGEIVLRVRDNGVGLAPEEMETVFERYAHTAPPRSPDQGGLGVGLAVVREVAHLHGGTVAATSKGKGLGSEFLLRLPANVPARIDGPLEA